jgi:hypothetical protein
MRRARPQPIRNKLDLTDRIQVRLVKKRLKLTDAALSAIVGRIGNSLSAISKEAAQQHASTVPQPAELPAPTAIAATAASEQITAEAAQPAPAT